MSITYMDDKWSDITRDERFFCAELYQIIKDKKHPFLEFLLKERIINYIDNSYDIGYEVCFYRDYIFKYGYGAKNNKNHHIKTIENLNVKARVRVKNNGKIEVVSKLINKFPPKRTFDLCLFSKDEIIIIEAKAQQGFEMKQLSSFEEDRELLKKLLGTDTQVKVIGLCSSEYTPGEDTRNYFDTIITWKEIHEKYNNQHKILSRADESYRKKCNL